MRREEIIGLKWSAIDFDKKTISIRHTVVEYSLDGKVFVEAKDCAKNKSSVRSLPLVPFIEQRLLIMREEQKECMRVCGSMYCRDYLEYVFVNQLGERMLPDYVTRHFRILLKNKGMRHIRFHDLRHSCASLLFANGVSLKQIQEWLGHSNISTTSNIYTHLDFTSKISSASAIEHILAPAETNTE